MLQLGAILGSWCATTNKSCVFSVCLFPFSWGAREKEVEERNCLAGCGLALEGCQHWNNFVMEEAVRKFQECHLQAQLWKRRGDLQGELVPANPGSTRRPRDQCFSQFPPQTFIFRGLWVCSKNPLRVYTWFTPGLCLPKFILTAFLWGSSSGSSSWAEPDAQPLPTPPFTTSITAGVNEGQVAHNCEQGLPAQLMEFFQVISARRCGTARVS